MTQVVTVVLDTKSEKKIVVRIEPTALQLAL